MSNFIDYKKFMSKKKNIHYGYTYSQNDVIKRFEENKKFTDSVSYNEDESIYLDYNNDDKNCYYDYIVKKECDIISIHPDVDGDIEIYNSFYIINGVKYDRLREEIILAAIKEDDIKFRVIFKKPPDKTYRLDIIVVKKIVNENLRNILSNNHIKNTYLKYNHGECSRIRRRN